MTNDNSCDCCEGTSAITPEPVYNRPGLPALAYRIGTHGSFLETMKARLASNEFPALAGLTARTGDDPAIATLDAWATVADVLTFYQERVANEGFLRTATERRSVTELARLIGYSPRPGVAATVYLAYTVDENADAPAVIEPGAKVQSVPGPGELPQTFETSDKLIARKEWNAIKPRLTRPQTLETIAEGSDALPGARVYFKGINTNLKKNDALLFTVGTLGNAVLRVGEVIPDSKADRTHVTLLMWDGSKLLIQGVTQVRHALKRFADTNAAAVVPNSLSAQVLNVAGEFLAWLYDIATQEPVPGEVQFVLNDAGLVQAMLEPFDRLREAATSAVPDKTLAKIILREGITIAELADEISGHGESGVTIIPEQLKGVAAALEEIGAKGGDTSGQKKQEQLLAGLMRRIVGQLAIAKSIPPRSSQSLTRDAATLYEAQSDVGAQAVAALMPEIANALATAMANAKVAPDNPIRVYALRQRTLLFGSTAARKVTSVSRDTGIATTEEWSDADIITAEQTQAVHLDSSYDKIKPDSWVVLDFSAVDRTKLGRISLPSGRDIVITRAGAVNAKLARAEYNVSGQSTRVPLLNPDGTSPLSWFTFSTPPGTPTPVQAMQLIRRTAVYFESEELELAEEPIEDDICGGDQWIETNALLTGLPTGRWLIVSGERADVQDTSGVLTSELVMLDATQQYVQEVTTIINRQPAVARNRLLNGEATSPFDAIAAPRTERDAGARNGSDDRRDEIEPGFLPGDKLHTFVKLARPLSYCYKRDTVTIYANVVKATHGETRPETLGSGDGSKPLQSFTLRQPLLTFVPSPEPDGVTSTLRAYVNNVEWRETEALVMMEPSDRAFMTSTSDDGKTTLVFGNGMHGARLPTGVENVKAIYRQGIGKGGNVKARQISQLLTRPLGVKDVINPLPASGGADRETRDQARRNAPLALKALDRLVGTRDYADFARTFAGIGKAMADRVVDGGSEIVFVTIAGADDIPIEKSSDLYANLVAAMRRFGDPYQPFRVEMRELSLLVLSARIRIEPIYLWDDVVDRVRAKLLETFSFEQRELGQSVVLSQMIATMQNVSGVSYVDVESLGVVSQTNDDGQLRAPQEIAQALQKVIEDDTKRGRPRQHAPVGGIRRMNAGSMGQPNWQVRPAQIAFFVPNVPETLILNRIEG